MYFQAIADAGWEKPTLVQEKFIPLALEGKDILARARTGSGKTAAFAIPVIQKLLTEHMVCFIALVFMAVARKGCGETLS